MVDERRLDHRAHRELVEQVGRSGRVSVLRKLEHDIAQRLLVFIGARAGLSSPNDAAVDAFLVLHATEAMVHAILFLRPTNISRDDAIEGAVRMMRSASSKRARTSSSWVGDRPSSTRQRR